MSKNRINELLTFLMEDPNDPFTQYALALEYSKVDESKALDYFRILLRQHEEYVGTYYHAANLMFKLGLIEEARHTFEKGLVICKKLNKNHALKELQNSYQNFLFELE